MNKSLKIIIVLAVFVITLLLMGPLYVIHEGEQAVVVRFGAIVNVVTQPGLHVRIPFIDEVVRYPKRIMSWNGEQSGIPTLERQFIIVDVTARWRIADPKRFYESIGNVTRGNMRLGEIINSEVRTVVAENNFHESVRNSNHIIDRQLDRQRERQGIEDMLTGADMLGGADMLDVTDIMTIIQGQVRHEPVARGRSQLASEILTRSRRMVPEYGIELIDVVTRQIRYSDELAESVYARMVMERRQVAQYIRSEGEGRRASILGEMERELMDIMSSAEREAQTIRALADAYAARVYAAAFNQDQNFFEFWRAIESYRTVLPGFDMALSTDLDFFRFLYSINGR